MASAAGTQKVCVICGEDCSSKPRTKDAKGRYYCKPCHEHAVEKKYESAPLTGVNHESTDAEHAIQAAEEGPALDMLQDFAQAAPAPMLAMPSRPRPKRGVPTAVWIVAGAGFALLAAIGIGIAVLIPMLGEVKFNGPKAAYDNGRVSFQYPQEWIQDEYRAMTGEEFDVTISAASGGYIRVAAEKSPVRLETMLTAWVDDAQVMLSNPYHGDDFTSWGSFAGSGKTLEGNLDDKAVRLRVFAAKLDLTRILHVVEVIPDDSARQTRAGFELVRSTCKVN